MQSFLGCLFQIPWKMKGLKSISYKLNINFLRLVFVETIFLFL